MSAVVCGLLAVLTAAGQEGGMPTAPVEACSLEQLATLCPATLEQLYRAAGPGCIPNGFVRGRAIHAPDTLLAGPRATVANFVWRGKVFQPCEGMLVNQWRGLRAVRARIYEGPSWLDGQPSLIMDYRGTSPVVWSNVRDEIREVAPGLYVGLMYRYKPCGPKLAMYFALDARACCDCPARSRIGDNSGPCDTRILTNSATDP
jgi:hypothetical protein